VEREPRSSLIYRSQPPLSTLHSPLSTRTRGPDLGLAGPPVGRPLGHLAAARPRGNGRAVGDRESELGFLASWSFSRHGTHKSFSENGTNWHWLATFQKVLIPDLQAQKGFKTRVPNGLVQSPSATPWAIGSGVPERGFAHCGSLRGLAQNGSKWPLFRGSSCTDLQAQKGFKSPSPNGSVQSPSARTTGSVSV